MRKLNFLLVMPRLVASIGEGYHFPLGIAYISAIMKQSGFQVFTLNLNHIEGEINEIVNNEVIKHKIDVLMTGGLSGQYSSIKSIIDCVHNCFSDVQIIVGGGLVTADPQVAMIALENANIGVIGEGEETAVELCNALQGVNSIDLSDIAGIIYSNNGSWTQTKPREEIMDLDSLPFPDYDGFEIRKYLELSPAISHGMKGSKSFSLISSRSCPYQCTFCFHTLGKKYRQRSMDNVINEIELLMTNYNIKHIKISDELFARNKERVRSIEDFSRNNGITWNASFRVDDIDEELIEIMKNGTCTSMVFGLESADDGILKSMRKNISKNQIEKSLKLVYEAGLTTNGNFIFGDIEETLETADATLDWYEKHKHYGILLDFIITFPGTHLYRYALQNGIIKDPVQFLRDGCPHVNVSKMSDDEFSLIAKRILLLSAEARWEVKDIEDVKVDDTGRISFYGECINCGKKQTFNDVPAFFIKDWTFCIYCGQKHEIQLPKVLIDTLVENIRAYLKYNKKIALWGITPSALVLFESDCVFMNTNIIYVDSSPIKQKIRIHGKEVFSPDDALTSGINTAIYFHTPTYGVASEKVKQRYPNIEHFYKACDLLMKRGE